MSCCLDPNRYRNPDRKSFYYSSTHREIGAFFCGSQGFIQGGHTLDLDKVGNESANGRAEVRLLDQYSFNRLSTLMER